MSLSAKSATRLSVGGAILAALAASSCCVGPLILVALGIGGAGGLAVMGAYRPYFLVGTAALLGTGYYFVYRKPKQTTDACGCARPSTTTAGRSARIGLWCATFVTALFAAMPSLLAYAEHAHAPAGLPVGAPIARATLQVRGIDCEGCAAGLRKAMSAVGGFGDLQLDVPHQTVAITYQPAPGRLEAYAKAIEDETGFEVTLPPAAMR
ncbi:MAG: heavy metal-associated domain-containing protein [Labilithrix sp.]